LDSLNSLEEAMGIL